MPQRWTRPVVGVLCLATALLAAPGARAAEAIGVATEVHPQVSQVSGSSEQPIGGGQSVTRDEVVKTGPNGSTKIVFTDSTHLSIGASSRIALTNFVFAGKKNYEKATFQLAKGAFRFATGGSDKHAYEINTPTATLGVRGTVFEVKVTDEGTTVEVISGEVHMCPINFDPQQDEGKDCNSNGGGAQGGRRKPGCHLSCSDITAGGSGTILASDLTDPGGTTFGGNQISPTPPGAPPPPVVVPPPSGPCGNTSASRC